MLSCAVDLMERGTYHHGQKVAYIALHIFEHMEISEDPADLVIASIFMILAYHHLRTRKGKGVFASSELLREHCLDGAYLVESVDILKDLKYIILHHHTRYTDIDKQAEEVPLEAQIINLADRVEVLIKPDKHILEQVDNIVDTVLRYRGTLFNPDIMDAFLALSAKESFWLDISNEYQHKYEHIDFPGLNIK